MLNTEAVDYINTLFTIAPFTTVLYPLPEIKMPYVYAAFFGKPPEILAKVIMSKGAITSVKTDSKEYEVTGPKTAADHWIFQVYPV